MPKPIRPRVSNRPNSSASRILASRIPTPQRVDTSSMAYKQAASKYTRFMIAMPILLVTSYYLFDRLPLKNEPKTFRSHI
ncbi:hypothetical protein F5B17DRAFT_414457 [Nemania serpens]|nr:hypothetical protein F5B17DRAFT_414457 [Nemania serpens]